MNMPGSEYNKIMEMIKNWKGSKEGLQRLYDEIYQKYDDASDVLRRLDKYQSKWTMDLH